MEDKFSESTEGTLDFHSIPVLARENVLKYLAGEWDVKACRLVCKEWYQYFDCPRFRDKEHFVFNGRKIRSVDDINDVLLGYRGSGVNVNFVDVPLGELNFEDFGDKIHGIRVRSRDEKLGRNDRKALVKMLTHTLNIRYFRYHKAKNSWKSHEKKRDIEQEGLAMVIIELRRRKLTFNELRCFDTTRALWYYRDFFKIFPRLKSLRSRCLRLCEMVESDGLLTMERLTEIRKMTVLMKNFRKWEEECDFLLSLPKLKKLDVGFQFDSKGRKYLQNSLDICLNFFTRQTELETLRISLKCHYICDVVYLDPANDGREECTDGGYHCEAAKQLSFHILRSCAKLKVLHLKLRGVRMRFSDADLREFVHLVRSSGIRDLTFPLVVLERAPFRSHFASLHLDSLKLHRYLNFHKEGWTATTEALEALSAFLRSNKNLRRMKIQSIALRPPGWIVQALEGADQDIASIINGPEKLFPSVHHDRLEHLAIDFHYNESLEGILFVEYLMSLELPRLLSLKLGKKRKWRLPHHSPVDAGTEGRFRQWIQKMRRLEIVYLHLWWLSFEKVLEICRPLRELQVLAFSNYVYASRESKLRDLFRELPALKKIWYHGSGYRYYARHADGTFMNV